MMKNYLTESLLLFIINVIGSKSYTKIYLQYFTLMICY